MKQAIGIGVVAASALVLWAGITNAGGKSKGGAHIPTLREQVGIVLSGGKPVKAPA